MLTIQRLLDIWIQFPCFLPCLELHWSQHVTKVRARKSHTLFQRDNCRIDLVNVQPNQLLQDGEATQLAATFLGESTILFYASVFILFDLYLIFF